MSAESTPKIIKLIINAGTKGKNPAANDSGSHCKEKPSNTNSPQSTDSTAARAEQRKP
jgi:hypothetical protein